MSGVAVISRDLLNQEEGPGWREVKMASEFRENTCWRCAKNNLTAKAEPGPGGGRTVLKTFGVQDLSVFRISWGDLCQLGRNNSPKSEPDLNF